MTAFIRHEGLLDFAGIDAIITAAARLSSEDAGILDLPISSGAFGHRLSGHAAYRQFRRPRSAEARTRCRSPHDFAGAADSAEAALVILAGSKATIADLHTLRRWGAEQEVHLDNDGLISIAGH